MTKKVAVLQGGHTEREISLLSGQAVYEALQKREIDAVMIDQQDPEWINELIKGKFTAVFIALHGGAGEDGTVQGLLESLQIPYTGSGVLASALGMDKIRCKRIWQSLGLPTPSFMSLREDSNLSSYTDVFGFPFVVKPVFGGSSIGVSRITDIVGLHKAYQESSQYGPLMLEPWIFGDEFTVAILHGRVLPVVRIMVQNDFYDYNAKYVSKKTEYICKSQLDSKTEQYVQKLAYDAFTAIGGSGWGRVDLIRDLNGDFWLLEVNTVPGMTKRSLVPTAARAANMSFEDLVVSILDTAETYKYRSVRINA